MPYVFLTSNHQPLITKNNCIITVHHCYTCVQLILPLIFNLLIINLLYFGMYFKHQ